jgi:hypothetical protein
MKYRCYHCKQEFDEDLALGHFGTSPVGFPRCVEDWVNGRGGGPHDPRNKWLDELVAKIDRLEAELRYTEPICRGYSVD